MKQPTYKEKETLIKKGKKRFIERIVETEEAEKQIKEFLEHTDKKDLDEDRTTIRNFT